MLWQKVSPSIPRQLFRFTGKFLLHTCWPLHIVRPWRVLFPLVTRTIGTLSNSKKRWKFCLQAERSMELLCHRFYSLRLHVQILKKSCSFSMRVCFSDSSSVAWFGRILEFACAHHLTLLEEQTMTKVIEGRADMWFHSLFDAIAVLFAEKKYATNAPSHLSLRGFFLFSRKPKSTKFSTSRVVVVREPGGSMICV